MATNSCPVTAVRGKLNSRLFQAINLISGLILITFALLLLSGIAD